MGVTESTYGDYVEVNTEFRDPSGNLLSSQYGAGVGFARADVATAVNANSDVEGDFSVNSYHWSSGLWLGLTQAIIGRTVMRTRYILNSTEVLQDPHFGTLCRKRYLYTVYNCYGICQKPQLYTSWYNGFWYPGGCDAVDPAGDNPAPYMQGIGGRWRVLFVSWCQFQYSPRSHPSLTQCIW